MAFDAFAHLSATGPSFFSPRDGWLSPSLGPASATPDIEDVALLTAPDSLLRNLIDESHANFPTLYMLSPSPSRGLGSISPYSNYGAGLSPPRYFPSTPMRTRVNSLPRPIGELHSDATSTPTSNGNRAAIPTPPLTPATPANAEAIPLCCDPEAACTLRCISSDDDCAECALDDNDGDNSTSQQPVQSNTSTTRPVKRRPVPPEQQSPIDAAKRSREEGQVIAKLSPHLLLHLSILQQLDASKEHCIIKLEDLVALQNQLAALQEELFQKKATADCSCQLSSTDDTTPPASSSSLSPTSASSLASLKLVEAHAGPAKRLRSG